MGRKARADYVVHNLLKGLPPDERRAVRESTLKNQSPELEAAITERYPGLWGRRSEEEEFVRTGKNTWKLKPSVEDPGRTTEILKFYARG